MSGRSQTGVREGHLSPVLPRAQEVLSNPPPGHRYLFLLSDSPSLIDRAQVVSCTSLSMLVIPC